MKEGLLVRTKRMEEWMMKSEESWRRERELLMSKLEAVTREVNMESTSRDNTLPAESVEGGRYFTGGERSLDKSQWILRNYVVLSSIIRLKVENMLSILVSRYSSWDGKHFRINMDIRSDEKVKSQCIAIIRNVM